MQKSLRIISLIIFGLVFGTFAVAQITPTEDTQVWSDVQLLYPLNEKTDGFLTGTFRSGRDVSHPVDERIGGGLTFKPNKFVTITLAYLYLAQQPLKNVKRYENRVNLAAIFSYPLGKYTISDRNQFERRFLNSRPNTWRYRNRLQVERTFTAGKFKYSLYTSDEIFYDSGAEAWTRNRFLAGFTHKISPNYAIDLYGGRQNDGRVKPGNWNIIGTALKIRLK
jgi:hypothetical protein